MGGIVGFIGKEAIRGSLLSDMYESIKYVEKDCIDKWNDVFLSVSRVHHGIINPESQPIFNEDESLLIVMDGEVFDYEEQKLQLFYKGHEFRFKNNDAEYCLHLYEEMGETAFRELNGSFCLVIYNLFTHEFLLVNDRISTHPIFYYKTPKNTLLFSTQLSAILQSPEVPRCLNRASIFEFFTFKKILGPKTFYQDINILPPATILRYKHGSVSFSSYWKMEYKEKKRPERYYVESLAEGIKESVARRLKGGHRFGILLSGGLDSRLLFAVNCQRIVSFTVGDFENRQVKTAKLISRAMNCRHIFLKRKPDHYVHLIDRAVEIGSGMYLAVCAHNIGLFERIQKECDILLHGFLFDTLFKGWSIPPKNIRIFNKKLSVPFLESAFKIETLLDNSLLPLKPEQLFAFSYSAEFKDSITASLDTFLNEAKQNGASDKHREFDYFAFPSAYNQMDYLYALHNRAYIDERTIAIDNDLMDLYLETPIFLRMNGRILKKAMQRINPKLALIPNANTGLPIITIEWLDWIFSKAQSVLEKKIFYRRNLLRYPFYSHGSWPNYEELIRHSAEMKKCINETIEDRECLDPLIFNIPRIKKIFNEHLNGTGNYALFLFLLLTFGKWHKKYKPF